jgi:hypothetical protein
MRSTDKTVQSLRDRRNSRPDDLRPPPMREVTKGFGIFSERPVEADEDQLSRKPRGGVLGFLANFFHS